MTANNKEVEEVQWERMQAFVAARGGGPVGERPQPAAFGLHEPVVDTTKAPEQLEATVDAETPEQLEGADGAGIASAPAGAAHSGGSDAGDEGGDDGGGGGDDKAELNQWRRMQAFVAARGSAEPPRHTKPFAGLHELQEQPEYQEYFEAKYPKASDGKHHIGLSPEQAEACIEAAKLAALGPSAQEQQPPPAVVQQPSPAAVQQQPQPQPPAVQQPPADIDQPDPPPAAAAETTAATPSVKPSTRRKRRSTFNAPRQTKKPAEQHSPKKPTRSIVPQSDPKAEKSLEEARPQTIRRRLL